MLKTSQIRFCAMECERQQTSPRAVADMCEALEHAYWISKHDPVGFFTLNFIERLGRMIEPNENEFGFRVMPVYFGDATRQAIDPGHIKQALISLITHGQGLTPAEGYYEFEKIHPFNDGNGRVGAILYNIWNGTLANPVIPPDMFKEPIR